MLDFPLWFNACWVIGWNEATAFFSRNTVSARWGSTVRSTQEMRYHSVGKKKLDNDGFLAQIPMKTLPSYHRCLSLVPFSWLKKLNSKFPKTNKARGQKQCIGLKQKHEQRREERYNEEYEKEPCKMTVLVSLLGNW